MITVALVDDHPVVRAGLKAVLEKAPDILVVAEGECGKDAIRIVEDLSPNVIVLDLNLPDIHGVEVTRQIASRKAQTTPTAILILTFHRDNPSVYRLLECGALGYVLKDEALETLVSAIRAVAQGENWLSPAITRQVIRKAVGQDDRKEDVSGLTPRELEILSLLAQGLDNTAIASRLVLTTRTIQNHVSNIYSKLGTASRTEAALYAIRSGIAPAPPRESNPDERRYRG
jgi:DNA-binding NarL/FixJ family response regulator